MQKIFDNKKMSRLKPGEKVRRVSSTNSSNGNRNNGNRSGGTGATYTGTIENKKYDHSVYRTFSKQQKNQLRLMRLKSSGDTGSSSGSSSGQKRTISAITTPETAAAKKLRKKKQGAGVQFGSSGRNPIVDEDQQQ